MIGNIRLMAIIILIFSAFMSGAAAQDNSANDTQNAAVAPGDTTSASGDVQGIWKATLGEKEVILSVNRSTQSLFGLAKYEGENPWNAALSGFIDQDLVFISLGAVDGDALASISIRANLVGENMSGFFVRSDSNGKASRGEFSAILINPDTSGYTPAAVLVAPVSSDKVEQATADQTTVDQKNETASAVASDATQEASAAIADSTNRFKDVTQLAKGINPDILPRMAPL
jgi:hypothetical protein